MYMPQTNAQEKRQSMQSSSLIDKQMAHRMGLL
jgi:hypothetical protein